MAAAINATLSRGNLYRRQLRSGEPLYRTRQALCIFEEWTKVLWYCSIAWDFAENKILSLQKNNEPHACHLCGAEVRVFLLADVNEPGEAALGFSGLLT
jgi:hypothetical protein